MKALIQIDGCMFAAIDEFSTFVDAIDERGGGNADRSRYLSLWSGVSWKKKTKTAGLESVENPRFQFTSFLQNFFLMDMIVNRNQFDGFLPRFIVATPKEVFVPIKEKMQQVFGPEDLDMEDLLSSMHSCFYPQGVTFKVDGEAMKPFEAFHDDYVMNERKKDLFDDKKSMILSKAIGNVLRISGIQAALRYGEALSRGDDVPEQPVICKEDMMRSISLVKYSVECMMSLVEVLDDRKVI